MLKCSTSQQPAEKPKNRLHHAGRRRASALIFLAAAAVLLYTIYRTQFLITISAAAFFLLLWLIPALWDGIIFLFGRKPETIWERISLNVMLATLAALTFEDAFEVAGRLSSFLLRFFEYFVSALNR